MPARLPNEWDYAPSDQSPSLGTLDLFVLDGSWRMREAILKSHYSAHVLIDSTSKNKTVETKGHPRIAQWPPEVRVARPDVIVVVGF